jgi:hypothetical protein
MKKITILGVLCILAVACNKKRAVMAAGGCVAFLSRAQFVEALPYADSKAIEKCPEADRIAHCDFGQKKPIIIPVATRSF